MKTKNLIVRVSFIISMILGTILLMSDLDNSKFETIAILVGFISLFGSIIYVSLKNSTEEEINNILGLTWLEKKTGINFTEE